MTSWDTHSVSWAHIKLLGKGNFLDTVAESYRILLCFVCGWSFVAVSMALHSFQVFARIFGFSGQGACYSPTRLLGTESEARFVFLDSWFVGYYDACRYP